MQKLHITQLRKVLEAQRDINEGKRSARQGPKRSDKVIKNTKGIPAWGVHSQKDDYGHPGYNIGDVADQLVDTGG